MKHRMGSTASLGSLGLSGNTCVLTPGSLLLIPDPRGQELKGIMAQSWLDHGVSMWESQKYPLWVSFSHTAICWKSAEIQVHDAQV